MANRRFRLVVAWILAAAASVRLIGLVSESFANMDDFRLAFVVASRAAWQGSSPYHPPHIALPGQDLGTVSPFATPPFLMLFEPLTALPDEVGRAAWIGLQLLAAVATAVVVYRGIGRPTWTEVLVAASLIVFFPPLRDSLQEGQIAVFLGLAFALALLAHQRGRPVMGGTALGLAIALKLTPMLALPYFIYRRDWRLTLTALATAALLGLMTLGLGWAHYWPGFVTDIGAAANGTALVRNQSLNGVLLRALRPDLNGLPIAPLDLGIRAVWLAAQGLVAVSLLAIVRRGRLATPEREWTEWACILLLLPLVQPFAWEHHFAQALMVVPVAVHLVSRRRLGLAAALALSAVYACDVMLSYPAFAAAKAVSAAVLQGSLMLEVAASITTIAAILAALLLMTAGRRPEVAG